MGERETGKRKKGNTITLLELLSTNYTEFVKKYFFSITTLSKPLAQHISATYFFQGKGK